MSRRTRIEGGQNLDSLLDTMANVVGILIVLMAVTQIHVGEAMDRIRSLARSEAISLRSTQAHLTTRWLTLAPERDEVTSELARLREQRDALAPAFAPEDAQRARALETELRALRARLAALRIEVDAAAADAAQRAVRLPDPRPAPARAEPLVFFVRHERVVGADLPELEEAFLSRVRALSQSAGSADALIGRLESEDIGDAHFRWRMYRAGSSLLAQLRWRDTQDGETARELAATGSAFERALAKTDPGRHYLVFHVWGDSFATYLAARHRAEAAGFAAGWVPYDSSEEFEAVLADERRDDPVPID